MEDLRLSKIGNLHDQTALVTGGGTGIGFMLARALASNGATVYITGRRKEKLESAASTSLPDGSGQLKPLQMDVTSKDSIQAAVSIIEKEVGRLDILVNNAGVTGKDSPFETENKSSFVSTRLFKHQSFEDWEQVYRSNTIAPFMVTNAFLELLRFGGTAIKGSTSSVINISSAVTQVNVAQNMFAYKVLS